MDADRKSGQSRGHAGHARRDHRLWLGAVRLPPGTYEVTNTEYTEFLNAKAVSDPLLLYNPSMGTISGSTQGGITRSGSDGSYTYSVIPGRGSFPVIGTTFYHAMRFANWMNNGQGNGDTESGAYTLLGGTPTPSNGTTVTRDASAMIVVPSEDEWYKAAYYDALSVTYFDYPTGFDAPPACCPDRTPQPRELRTHRPDIGGGRQLHRVSKSIRQLRPGRKPCRVERHDPQHCRPRPARNARIRIRQRRPVPRRGIPRKLPAWRDLWGDWISDRDDPRAEHRPARDRGAARPRQLAPPAAMTPQLTP